MGKYDTLLKITIYVLIIVSIVILNLVYFKMAKNVLDEHVKNKNWKKSTQIIPNTANTGSNVNNKDSAVKGSFNNAAIGFLAVDNSGLDKNRAPVEDASLDLIDSKNGVDVALGKNVQEAVSDIKAEGQAVESKSDNAEGKVSNSTANKYKKLIKDYFKNKVNEMGDKYKKQFQPEWINKTFHYENGTKKIFSKEEKEELIRQHYKNMKNTTETYWNKSKDSFKEVVSSTGLKIKK